MQKSLILFLLFSTVIGRETAEHALRRHLTALIQAANSHAFATIVHLSEPGINPDPVARFYSGKTVGPFNAVHVTRDRIQGRLNFGVPAEWWTIQIERDRRSPTGWVITGTMRSGVNTRAETQTDNSHMIFCLNQRDLVLFVLALSSVSSAVQTPAISILQSTVNALIEAVINRNQQELFELIYPIGGNRRADPIFLRFQGVQFQIQSARYVFPFQIEAFVRLTPGGLNRVILGKNPQSSTQWKIVQMTPIPFGHGPTRHFFNPKFNYYSIRVS
ncbi:unnamed protein product [Caenorhabditis sp. 36 PRJEB53466]|nr:unnamed protein product [Caenorhabditis sp. 36 PRJEB53466]